MTASLFKITGDAEILDRIRNGDEEVLVDLYQSNRKPILNLVSKNSGSHDDAEDMLQESLIVLWERVRSGRFEQNAKLSTFLYATARNLWFGRLRLKARLTPLDIDPVEHRDHSPSALEDLVAAEETAIVRDALGMIGEQCRKLLLLFYWEELSMGEIAGRLGFANAETAKAKKYQCKKALGKALGALRMK